MTVPTTNIGNITEVMINGITEAFSSKALMNENIENGAGFSGGSDGIFNVVIEGGVDGDFSGGTSEGGGGGDGGGGDGDGGDGGGGGGGDGGGGGGGSGDDSGGGSE